MKRFKFRLEAVQRLRAAAEKEAMADLARALGIVRQLEEALESIAAERRRVLAVVDEGTDTGALDLEWTLRHHADLARLDRSDDQVRQQIEAARAAYDDARTQLRERQADRRALDVLEDKARERHDEEVRREQHLVMDEIAMQRHGRQRS